MAARKTATATAVTTHASLNEALFAVQQQMPAFQRDSVNPHFGSKYLALETLLPQVVEVLNANGLLLSQSPTIVYAGSEPQQGGLRTSLTHVATGESSTDTMLLAAGKETPQAQGSAITYAKRYALMAILNITADKDDDGTAAMPARTVQPALPSAPYVQTLAVQGVQSAQSDVPNGFPASL